MVLQVMKETILSDTAVAFATYEISFLKDHSNVLFRFLYNKVEN